MRGGVVNTLDGRSRTLSRRAAKVMLPGNAILDTLVRTRDDTGPRTACMKKGGVDEFPRNSAC